MEKQGKQIPPRGNMLTFARVVIRTGTVRFPTQTPATWASRGTDSSTRLLLSVWTSKREMELTNICWQQKWGASGTLGFTPASGAKCFPIAQILLPLSPKLTSPAPSPPTCPTPISSPPGSSVLINVTNYPTPNTGKCNVEQCPAVSPQHAQGGLGTSSTIYRKVWGNLWQWITVPMPGLLFQSTPVQPFYTYICTCIYAQL